LGDISDGIPVFLAESVDVPDVEAVFVVVWMFVPVVFVVVWSAVQVWIVAQVWTVAVEPDEIVVQVWIAAVVPDEIVAVQVWKPVELPDEMTEKPVGKMTAQKNESYFEQSILPHHLHGLSYLQQTIGKKFPVQRKINRIQSAALYKSYFLKSFS